MTVTSKEEFAKSVMSLAEQAEPFKPTATYDPDGDCIEFLFKADAFYAERIDGLVTVYYSQDSREVIGSLLKGITKFLKKTLTKFPGFKIEIRDGEVCLQHIFLAGLWSEDLDPESLATRTYQKLIQVSKETKVEGELCLS